MDITSGYKFDECKIHSAELSYKLRRLHTDLRSLRLTLKDTRERMRRTRLELEASIENLMLKPNHRGVS